VFNGNNYSEDWTADAKQRGLFNLETTVDALPEFISQKSADLFGRGCSDAEARFTGYGRI
jgi:glutamine synthetase